MISGSACQHKRVLHAGAPRAPGVEKSTQKMTAPSQQTFAGSPRAADDHGIHVTSHSGQVIRLPTPGTPRLPQFQHSLGSVLCWLPLICFPPQLFSHDRDLRPGGNACTWRRLGRRRLIHPRTLPMDLRAVSPASWIIPVVPPVPGSRLPPAWSRSRSGQRPGPGRGRAGRGRTRARREKHG